MRPLLPVAGLLASALLAGAVVGVGGCRDQDAPARVHKAFPEIDAAGLDTWSAWLKPHGDEEAWKDVGWRSSMWDAILEARATDRPLLVWSMNGHPLGFT